MVMFYRTKQKKTNIVYQYQEKTIIFLQYKVQKIPHAVRKTQQNKLPRHYYRFIIIQIDNTISKNSHTQAIKQETSNTHTTLLF